MGRLNVVLKFCTYAATTFTVLSLTLIFITACTYENQPLPILEFPLTETGITRILEESGLLWRAEEIDVLPEGYTLPEGIIRESYEIFKGSSQIGFLTTMAYGEDRMVSFVFLTYFGFGSHMDVHNHTREEWENIIIFITRLYGGFENDKQVFRYFDNEVGDLERESINIRYFDARAIWECEIGGAYVYIEIERRRDSYDEYLRDIKIVSDHEWLFPLGE